MAAIGEWVRVLIVVVLLGNLVEFVLPKGDIKRYGGLVVGLVILAVLVNPLWAWLHQVPRGMTLQSVSWTNTPIGFQEVVQSEELHQAEAIVLSMPQITGCRLTMGGDGVVDATVQAEGGMARGTALHYVRAALHVTMAQVPQVRLMLSNNQAANG